METSVMGPASKCLGIGCGTVLLLMVLVPNASAQTVDELLTGETQTIENLRFAIEESVDGGDYELAIEQLARLIPRLEDLAERAEYEQYLENLIATFSELSEFERWHVRMSGAGRQLATIQLGGEAAYEAATSGGIPTDNTDRLVGACENELEHRMGFHHPLRLTSQPWVIAIDEGLYNISGIISGPEWGRLTGRWRYHCLVHHSYRGIQVLRSETW